MFNIDYPFSPDFNKLYLSLSIKNQTISNYINGSSLQLELQRSKKPIYDLNECVKAVGSGNTYMIDVGINGNQIITLDDIDINKDCIMKQRYTLILYYDLRIKTVGKVPKIIAKEMALSVTTIPPNTYEVKMSLLNNNRLYWKINNANTKNDILLPPKFFNNDVVNAGILEIGYYLP